MFFPDYETFVKKGREGNLVPVYAEILADLDTPLTAYIKVCGKSDHSFLFESVEGGEKWGRYSFLGANPSVILETTGKKVRITRGGKTTEREVKTDPLDELKGLLAEYKPVPVDGLPRFFGGAVGYIGHDMIRFFENIPDKGKPGTGAPDSVFMISDTIVIFDNVSHKIKVVSNAHIEKNDFKRAYDSACSKIRDTIRDLLSTIKYPLEGSGGRIKPGGSFKSDFSREEYENAVLRCKEYIREGDIFQVVLAQRLEREIDIEPLDIYRALRMINPSPYMYMLRLGKSRIVGSSPEILVRLDRGEITVRPLAGTRPRGGTAEEDSALVYDLLADEKELAEHYMLVDLGRNDVGRVARTGTVRVTNLKSVEKYSHVMHIVSNVVGKIAPGKDAFDVFRATFPAGTLTGAPKIRAMEIIDELEPVKRGIYGGAVGYVSFTGNMDMAIAIRTMLIRDKRAYIGVGAGIVADSVPSREYDETMNKGMALMRAVEYAERRFDSAFLAPKSASNGKKPAAARKAKVNAKPVKKSGNGKTKKAPRRKKR